MFFSNTTYVCPMFNGKMATFIGFTDGANRYMLNLASVAWVLYSPTCDLVSSGDVCLGPSTNNLIEYHAVIGLSKKSLANDVREIRLYLDLELFKPSLHHP